jgi:GNAT superfamily N-acetyltransferase
VTRSRIEIVDFEPELAGALARCYNETMSDVPYSLPAQPEWFAEPLGSCHQQCIEEQIFAAREGGDVVGFVHVGVAAPVADQWDLPGEPGVIRALCHRPGRRLAGAALLEAAERWARDRGRTEMAVGCERFVYPFSPMGSLSERVSHVPPLLWLAGYQTAACDVTLHWPDFEPPAVKRPDLDFELVYEEGTTRPRRHVLLHAMQGDDEIGDCNMYWLGMPQYRPQFFDWCYCGIGVAGEFQGRGLGKYLLSRALAAMREQGAKHTMLLVHDDNYLAQLFYANFGYRFLDRSFSFRKRLE